MRLEPVLFRKSPRVDGALVSSQNLQMRHSLETGSVPAMGHMPAIPAFGRRRQEDEEFKVR